MRGARGACYALSASVIVCFSFVEASGDTED
jgi:hypothetical protein